VRDDIRTTAIIPLVGAHVRFMHRLLSNVSSSTVPFHEVVVVASGLNLDLSARLKKICAGFPNLPIKVVSGPLAPAGANRNIGIENSDGNWVTFLDADDLYLPKRVERLIQAAFHYDAAAVGHDYSTFRSPLVGLLKLSISQVFGVRRTAKIPSARAIHSGDFVTSAAGESTNVTSLRLHHAHILVRRDVFTHLRFSDTPGRNEDGIFLRDLIEQGQKFIRVDEPLSVYYLGSRLRKMAALLVSRK
jgi:glycosyltransferase involved in cell wall biosynthesis